MASTYTPPAHTPASTGTNLGSLFYSLIYRRIACTSNITPMPASPQYTYLRNVSQPASSGSPPQSPPQSYPSPHGPHSTPGVWFPTMIEKITVRPLAASRNPLKARASPSVPVFANT